MRELSPFYFVPWRFRQIIITSRTSVLFTSFSISISLFPSFPNRFYVSVVFLGIDYILIIIRFKTYDYFSIISFWIFLFYLFSLNVSTQLFIQCWRSSAQLKKLKYWRKFLWFSLFAGHWVNGLLFYLKSIIFKFHWEWRKQLKKTNICLKCSMSLLINYNILVRNIKNG